MTAFTVVTIILAVDVIPMVLPSYEYCCVNREAGVAKRCC